MVVPLVPWSFLLTVPTACPFLSCEFSTLIGCAFAATEHASYHVTYAREGSNFPHIFEIPANLYITVQLNLYGSTIKINWVIQQNSARFYVKDHVAQKHVSLEHRRKSVTTVLLGDHNFLSRASNFGDLAAFRTILAIFSLRMRRNSSLWVSH